MKKYELVKDDFIEVEGKKLFRIRALKNFGFGYVKKGDLGGYIQDESNLSHTGNCWVYDNAVVYDKALVYDDAEIHEYAEVYEYAEIHECAKVYGSVFGHTKVYGYAEVRGNVIVQGSAEIHRDTLIK